MMKLPLRHPRLLLIYRLLTLPQKPVYHQIWPLVCRPCRPKLLSLKLQKKTLLMLSRLDCKARLVQNPMMKIWIMNQKA